MDFYYFRYQDFSFSTNLSEYKKYCTKQPAVKTCKKVRLQVIHAACVFWFRGLVEIEWISHFVLITIVCKLSKSYNTNTASVVN
jgi:hypothetical protein